MSIADAVVLAGAMAATWWLWPRFGPVTGVIPLAIGHFFLFCNVFRIHRTKELAWAGLCLVNVVAWAGWDELWWPGILVVQTPLTIALIAWEHDRTLVPRCPGPTDQWPPSRLSRRTAVTEPTHTRGGDLHAASRFVGCLVGTAVGDSLLLIGEGLSRRRIARRFPGTLRHRFLLGHGLVSDDTEHHALVAQCLLAHPEIVDAFSRRFAWRLRWWFLCLPAGIGMATLKACLRLWLGFPRSRSGVASGGDGPAMRVAIIGARFAADNDQRRAYVDAATLITHLHPHALAGAHAVAETSAWIVRGDELPTLWAILKGCSDDSTWGERLAVLRRWHDSGDTVDDLATVLGCPQHVSGWSMHAVPVAIGAWLRHRSDSTAGMGAIFRCGGDTDTIGAIAGAFYGLDGGEAAFDPQWVSGIVDFPLSVNVLRRIGSEFAASDARPVRWAWPLLPVRSLVFLTTVLIHGLRRILP